MNGKQAKFLRKLATAMRYDYGVMKREFAALDSVTKGRFVAKMKAELAARA